MKDIKSLYLTAKTSGNNDEIASYTEAINELLENKPNDFLLNLEYIISSDIGLPKLDKFVEKYGLSIGSYDDIITCLESCIKKCNNKKIDSSKYEESKKKFESFKEKYKNCFMMFEYFKDNISDEYMNTYYEFNQNGIQNSKLIKGMVEKYGESAIPDILITADNIGEDSVSQALKFLESYNSIPTYYQWIIESTHDITIHGDDSLNYIKEMHDKSLEGIYNNLKSRNDIIMREAVIMGNDPVFEYSEDEIDTLVNLISFKEYQLTCTESSEEALKLQNEIYSLYEEFDNLKDDLKDEIKEDTACSIIPMLPNGNNRNSTELHEDMSWMNTRNKKTGDAPGYLQKNHNLGYGEDDDLNIPKEHEPTLDDFKRSSVTDNTNNEDIGDDDSDLDKDNEVGAKLTPDEQRAINNYYYYTYNNSLNKNANSFNKTNNDDHSVDNSVDNSHKSDDHSTEKHVNSHNGNTDDHHNDIVNHKESFNEGFLDIFKKSKKEDDIPQKEKSYTRYFIPIDENEKDFFINNIIKFKSELLKTLNPLFNKYPIYGLSLSIKLDYENIDDEKLNEELSSILSKYGEYSSNPNKPYAILINNGKLFIDSLEVEISGYDQYDFMVILEKEYPDEVKRLSSIYDLNVRNNWTDIQWAEKLCGYDKSLNEITNDITNIITNEFKMIKNYEYIGDNDSGPVYSGDIDVDLLLSNIDRSRIESKTISVKTESFNDPTALNILPTNNLYTEEVGDADNMKPESDHPIKDTLMDIDQKRVKTQQEVKKKVQDIQNAGRAFMKPAKRTKEWVTNMINDWKDKDENEVKEKMADPRARKNIFTAIGWAIKTGSLAKAGLLLNPVFLFLTITKKVSNNKNEYRIRNEMIGELKTEIEIIDEKIEDARRNGDNKAKYQLMRLKNEINKKLVRVSGSISNKKWMNGDII